MQTFLRKLEPPPAELRGDLAGRLRKDLRAFMTSGAERRSQTNAPRSERVLEGDSIRTGLRKLFNGRCAFCEAVDETSPYLFRPPAEALPAVDRSSAHLYYVWLETAWENVFPICLSCRPSDASYFPVQGGRVALPAPSELNRFADENSGLWQNYPIAERATLLDPSVENSYMRHLSPKIDGTLTGQSERGEETLQHFNLNAAHRVIARQRAYEQYFARIRSALLSERGAEHTAQLLDFDSLEFGGTWFLLLRRLALRMGVGVGPRPVVSRNRIDRFYLPLTKNPKAVERLEAVWRQLAVEDTTAPTPPFNHFRRAVPARISGIRLRNFKAIEALDLAMPRASSSEEFFDQSHPCPSLLILGENSAGKSSILEALALALSDTGAREKLSIDAGRLVLDPALMGGVTSDPERSAEVTIEFSDGVSQTLEIVHGHMQERGNWDSAGTAVFAYGAFRQYQHKQRPRSPEKYIRNLFDGSVLSNPERWLLGLATDAFAMVMRALREILSIEGDFEVVERDLATQQCYLLAQIADSKPASFSRTPLSAVSSGFRSVLAMACDVMQGLMDPIINRQFESLATARGVVLIDEVEAHLHPRWKMQIMRGLRRALPQMTFIATTHDPLCLRGMDDGEVAVLQRVSTRGSAFTTALPVFVESVTELPPISELRVEQLLTSDFFQLYSTDAAEIEIELARVSDLLAKPTAELRPSEVDAVRQFHRDISASLPIGSSEVHRIVQEALAEYLTERRAASEKKMRELRQEAKDTIIRALRGF